MVSSSSSGNVTLKSFPADRCDALAILYMQNQDLAGKTPKELADMYSEALEQISEAFKAAAKEKAAEKHRARDGGAIF